jgi:hypothetical protein
MIWKIFNVIRRPLINISLIIISLLTIIVLLEIALRFTHYSTILSKNEEFRNYYISDPHKGYDIAANVHKFQSNTDDEIFFKVWSNELGCFDTPYKGDKDYILLIGDSFTHGHAPFADKWGTQMEHLLGYRVLKCGVPAYGTKQETLKAKGIIERVGTSPQLIILGYCLNDLEDDYLFPRYGVVDGYVIISKELVNIKTGETTLRKDLEQKVGLLSSSSLIKIKNFIKRESIIGRLLISSIRDRYVESPPKKRLYENIFLSFFNFKWMDNVWKEHFRNIQDIESIAAKNNAKLLIVIIPMKEQVYPFLFDWQGAELDREGPNKKVINFFDKEGINYIDLLPLFKEYANQEPRKSLSPSDDFYWRYDGHWSVKGEHLVGLLVAKYVLENNMVTITDKSDKLKGINSKLQEFRKNN